MTSIARVVFVSNYAPDHSYVAASAFGALRPVTSGNVPIFKTARLIDEIISVLVESTEEDYLLISGSSAVAALCMSVWLIRHPICKILLFDKSADDYAMRVVNRQSIELTLESTSDAKQRAQRGEGARSL